MKISSHMAKRQIDSMSFVEMMEYWKNSKVGDPMLQDPIGQYFAESMENKRPKISNLIKEDVVDYNKNWPELFKDDIKKFPRENFSFWGNSFNVTKAKEILVNDPNREVDTIPVKSWAEAWLLNIIDPETKKPTFDAKRIEGIKKSGKFSFSIGVRYEMDHAFQTDIRIPVILAIHDDGSPVLIDGNHRLAKAASLGVEKIPALVLSKEETKMVME